MICRIAHALASLCIISSTTRTVTLRSLAITSRAVHFQTTILDFGKPFRRNGNIMWGKHCFHKHPFIIISCFNYPNEIKQKISKSKWA